MSAPYNQRSAKGTFLRDGRSMADRLAEHIGDPDPSRCWNWQGAMFAKSGYGRVYSIERSGYAHREMWISIHGAISDDMHVCHRCDNRRCVNPDHLYLGTHGENMADRNRKGRQWRNPGEKNPMAKLTTAIVLDIRARSVRGEARASIAKALGLRRTYVDSIVTGRRWGHVVCGVEL